MLISPLTSSCVLNAACLASMRNWLREAEAALLATVSVGLLSLLD